MCIELRVCLLLLSLFSIIQGKDNTMLISKVAVFL